MILMVLVCVFQHILKGRERYISYRDIYIYTGKRKRNRQREGEGGGGRERGRRRNREGGRGKVEKKVLTLINNKYLGIRCTGMIKKLSKFNLDV